MWRSYNLGRRIVRLRVQHLLSDYGWLTYPNSPVAPIKSYSGYRGYALVLIVPEPFPLWRAQLEMSFIKNSALLPLIGNGGARFFTHSSWHLLRGAEGVEGWSTLIFSLPFLRLSLHNSASEASGAPVKCLPSSLSVKAGFLKAAFICFTISLSPPLFEISHDRAELN